jgi:hypothetical protein
VSEQPLDPYKDPPEERKRVNWWLLGAGMLLFGVGDFFYFFAAIESTTNTTGGLILLGLTVAVAAVLFSVHRSLSLGVVTGYVVMTIVSAGECTWAFGDPLNEGQGAFAALLLYPLAVLIVGIVAIVIAVKNRNRGQG